MKKLLVRTPDSLEWGWCSWRHVSYLCLYVYMLKYFSMVVFHSTLCIVCLSLCRFSEGGYLLTYDTKGIVRMLDSTHYGGLSWIPILDATKQVGNRSDHYFLVGMTHNPDEIRSVVWFINNHSGIDAVHITVGDTIRSLDQLFQALLHVLRKHSSQVY